MLERYNSLQNSITLAAWAVLLFAAAVPALAGTAGMSFPVNITLTHPLVNPPAVRPQGATGNSGYCIFQSQNSSAKAIVTIVCANNQFISIQPLPETRLPPSHSGSTRFMVMPSAPGMAEEPIWFAGSGTITTMHVPHNKWQQGEIMEVQVSY